MKSHREDQKYSPLELEEREVLYLKNHIQNALKGFGLKTFAVWRFFNSLELFQIQPNQYMRDEIVQLFNSQVNVWKTKCIPRMRTNATKFPIMKGENIVSVDEFLKWLQSMKLLDSTDKLVTQIDGEIHTILQENSTP